MIRIRQLLIATLFSIMVTGAAAKDSAPLADPKMRAAVSRFYADWTAAFEKRDLKTLMTMYHPETRYSAQGEPDKTLTQLRASWEAEFAQPLGELTWRSRIENVYARGDLIVVVAIWDATRRAAPGERPVHSIRSVDVLTGTPPALRVLHTVNYPL
jgi:ketosteroid isomerase-like protein